MDKVIVNPTNQQLRDVFHTAAAEANKGARTRTIETDPGTAATDEHPVLAGMKARLEAERDAAAMAERDIRDASTRYGRATTNAKKLEQLIGLFRVYSANGEFDEIPY